MYNIRLAECTAHEIENLFSRTFGMFAPSLLWRVVLR